MKKRVVALLCMLSMIGTSVLPVSASEAAEDNGTAAVEQQYTEAESLAEAFDAEDLMGMSSRVISEDYRVWEQSNPEWGEIVLGSSGKTMDDIGCMVTSVTKLIIQAGLKDPAEFNPGTLVNWLNENEGFTEYGGLYWGKVSKLVSFSSETVFLEEGTYSSADYQDEILAWVKEGKHMVLWVQNKGHWVAVDEAMTLATGEVYIMDSLPNTANNADVKLVDKYPSIYQVQGYTGGTTPPAADLVGTVKCGDNLAWELDDAGTLTIAGTGEMYDFDANETPWNKDLEAITSIVIENGVTSIGNYAFEGCTNLTSVEMADTVEWIGTSAFANCTSLTEIALSSNLENIANALFENCEALTEVIIPGSVTEVDLGAFSGCTKVTTIKIPKHVDTIKKSEHDNSLESITVASDNEKFAAVEGVLFDKEVKTLYCYPAGKDAESYEVPATVVTLAEGAFYDSELAEITLPDGLETIGDYAFSRAYQLTEIVIPDTVKEVGQACFSKCTALVSAELPEKLTTIEAFTFVNCSALEEISVPDTVTEIGTFAFSECTALNEIRFYGALPVIGENAFQNVEATVYYPTEWETVPGATAYGAKALDWTDYENHIWDEGKVTTEPTCESTGVLTKTCVDCGKTKEEVIPSTGHTFEWFVDVEPTEETVGYKHEECSGCGLIRNEDSEIPEVGHEHVIEKVEARRATCVNTGNIEYYWCEGCERAYKDENAYKNIKIKDTVIPMSEHKWDKGVVTRPTVEFGGYTTYTCTYCGEAKTGDLVDKLEAPIRIAGATRYETSLAIAKEYKEKMAMESFSHVIIADGRNFADALAGSYLAGVKKAPILMTNGKNIEELTTFVGENLAASGTIYILGGEAAVSKDVEDAFEAYTVKRLSGADRYATNLAILEEAGVNGEDIIVSTGKNYADSLSASATGNPILLVGKKLTAAQKEFLAAAKSDFYVIGGTGAVSADIETALEAYGNVTRLGGATRYETSVLIAETFFDQPYYAVLAYGHNFPDGLCGGPLAMAMEAPLIVTREADVSVVKQYASDNDVESGAVLGGEALISNTMAESIFGNSLVVEEIVPEN